MASKVLVPAAPFAKLKVQKSPQEPLPLQPQPQGFVIGTEATARVAHLEHSVRFLQEQHRLMLSGLHAEIEALRERNRDLQFQLIFNKESATKNSSPNTEDKENTVSAAENSEVESLKAEVGKLKREAAAARGEARVAEARALQLQRVVDLQAEKLRESEAQRGACSDERVGCEGLDETRSELRARLADAERLVRRLRADAERQRRELACMKNTLQASLRASGCGMEFGYQNYHFPALMPEYWREREHALRDEPPAGHGQPRGVRGTRRVLTLPELAGQAVPRATVYANHHTQPLQPRVNGYDKPKKSDMQHPNESTVSVPAETAPPRPRPRRHHRKHADHT